MYCISDWFGRLQLGIILGIIPASILIIIMISILGKSDELSAFSIITSTLLIYIFGVPLIYLLPANQK
jgi:hypothetical protein